MLTIYGNMQSNNTQKVVYVANFLGLEYEFVSLEFKDLQNEEHLARNPVGKVPVIKEDDFTLFESGAISKYLAEKNNSSLYPNGKQKALVDQWTDFCTIHVGGAMNKVFYNKVVVKMLNEPVDEVSLKDGLKFLTRFLPVVDRRLKNSKYLVGESLTLADINLLSILNYAEPSGVDLSKYESLVTWRNNLVKEEFYKKTHAN